MANKRIEFELYDNLTHEQRIHLSDFQIINSILNATEKDFTQEEKERLFVVIDYACSEDENDTSITKISDEIVEAYANGEVSLEILENAKASELLDCAIGIGCFEYLEEEEEENEET